MVSLRFFPTKYSNLFDLEGSEEKEEIYKTYTNEIIWATGFVLYNASLDKENQYITINDSTKGKKFSLNMVGITYVIKQYKVRKIYKEKTVFSSKQSLPENEEEEEEEEEEKEGNELLNESEDIDDETKQDDGAARIFIERNDNNHNKFNKYMEDDFYGYIDFKTNEGEEAEDDLIKEKNIKISIEEFTNKYPN